MPPCYFRGTSKEELQEYAFLDGDFDYSDSLACLSTNNWKYFFYRDSTYSCCCQPRRGLNDYGANRNIWSFISLSKKSLLIHMQQQSWWKSYGRTPLSWEKARNGNHRLMIRQRTIVIYGKCHFWSIVSRVQMGSTFLHWNSNSRVLKFWPDAVLNIPTV